MQKPFYHGFRPRPLLNPSNLLSDLALHDRCARFWGKSWYLLKSRAADELIEAIREVSQGNTYLSPSVSRTVVSAYLGQVVVPDDPLSSRERQVVQLIAEGKTTKEAAVQLGISVKTAETHRASLMRKLGARNVADVVKYCIRNHLIEM